MQDYTYSVFSIVAIAIHLIINFNLIVGRKHASQVASHYRGFLFGVLFYYMADAAWGIFAELRWIGPWYVDTIFFFLSLVVFVFMWCRFVLAYLDLGKWTSRVLSWYGYSLLSANVVLLAVNLFNDCFFYFDEQGKYVISGVRDAMFAFLVGYTVLIAAAVLAKAIASRDSVRRRSVMVLLSCLTLGVSIVLQIVWPLTPFTSLGCLIVNCFFQVFVVQDAQAAKHMAELESALERAKAAEKARSMFFSIVSHDIRTPLNAILGYSELLQRKAGTQADRDEALESIRASGTTLLQLVNDVLDLAKMDAGKLVLQPQPVRLSQLTDEVFASFRLAADGKGVSLLNRTEDVPAVMLDSHRFRQILFNLVGNAVKFTERGSVTVLASWRDGILDVSVADTGIGIPSDMLTHILDPFVQVQDPSHAPDRAGGTGLGLSICRRLAEVMGGEIVVKSELGKGSTFRVCIPVAPAGGDAVAAVSAVPNAPAALKNLPDCVLVVDDSNVNRSVLTAMLVKMGVKSVGQACDGTEALAELKSAAKSGSPYDLVLSDLWMPNMNGLEFIESLRADSRFRNMPVFAVTADTEAHRDARSRLFNGILLKPVTFGKLAGVFAVDSVKSS